MTTGDRAPLPFSPGEVLALLTPLQELQAGLYLLYAVEGDWATLRWLIDDEASEKVYVTQRETMLPVDLLQLFTPVGLRLAVDRKADLPH